MGVTQQRRRRHPLFIPINLQSSACGSPSCDTTHARPRTPHPHPLQDDNTGFAQLTVRVPSTQRFSAHDRRGSVVAGTPEEGVPVVDHWVFERPLKGSAVSSRWRVAARLTIPQQAQQQQHQQVAGEEQRRQIQRQHQQQAAAVLGEASLQGEAEEAQLAEQQQQVAAGAALGRPPAPPKQAQQGKKKKGGGKKKAAAAGQAA